MNYHERRSRELQHAGRKAKREGKPSSDCPYKNDSSFSELCDYYDWMHGYNNA